MVSQWTQYYASGVPMAESTGRDQQPYLYNGKEFVEAHGLNEYDSQARMYYATIMRTTTMDPQAEKYYHISPYSWCGNNPINRIDPNGMDVYVFDDDGKFFNKQKREGTHYGLILDDKGVQTSSFEFADPINDPKAIEDGSINRLQVVTDAQIENILAESGVEDQANKTNKYSYALRESNSSNIKGDGHMDYVITGLYQGATISAYDNYLFVTKTEGKIVAHNTYNFGNFLWGAGMAALGIPYPIAKLGAHLNNFFFDTDSKWHLDSKDDQFSIKLGYQWRQER